jgi:hypothetical protein
MIKNATKPAFNHMQVHIGPQNTWRRHCEILGENLGFDLYRYEVRLCKNVYQAVYEATLGLRRLYTFKKKIFFYKDQFPHQENSLKALAKEGLQLEAWPLANFNNPGALAFDKESLFLLYAVDDPVLGTFENQEALEGAIAEQNILKIRVSFHRHLVEGLPKMEKNTVHILGLPNGQAILLLGDRARFAPQGSELLNWSEDELLQSLAELKTAGTFNQIESKTKIEKFESRSDLGFSRLLPTETARIFDRAIIVWNDMDSFAVLQSLSERYKLPLPLAGSMKFFESLSLSRWGGTKGFEWLAGKGFPKEILRGALVVDVSAIDDTLINHLKAIRGQILEVQLGNA